ncbi:glycosyltransferase family 2 protein [Chloroflexia bacterium SDU3-3]|nr:glycosyltransferase family 2 protein [Chloroflexia bacterium SDU3-3]
MRETVGVIIVSFNTCALLRECLASLRGCGLPLRTLVVDNGSRDGSQAMVRAEFSEVDLIEPGRNLGFGAANNLGLRQLYGGQPAHAGPALLLNSDTVVHPGAIEALADFLAQHPRVGVVGPRLLNPDGSLQHAAFRFPTLSLTALDLFPPGEALPGRLYGSWWHGRYAQEIAGAAPFPIDHPLGACMLVRAEALAEVGGFDEDFFMYAEEVELCHRIRAAGWSIWQQPAAQVTHVGGASTSQLRSQMQIALWESRLRLFRKRYPRRALAAHRALLRVGMLRAALLAWAAFARRQISRRDLRERLYTCGRIAQLR